MKRSFRVLAVAMVSVIPAIAANINTRSFPVAIRADREPVGDLPICFKCDFVVYDMPLPEFTAKCTDKHEASLTRLLRAFKNKDRAELAAVIAVEPGQPQSERDEDIVSTLDLVSPLFSDEICGPDFEHVRVTTQFFIGQDIIFFLRWERGKGLGVEHLIGWRFSKDGEGNLLMTETEQLESVLGEALEALKKSPMALTLKGKDDFDYEYMVPGTEGDHPVYLQFNGKVRDFAVFEDEADANDEVMVFYQRAYRALKDDYPKGLASFLSKKSRDEYLSCLPDVNEAATQWTYEREIKRGVHVVFVMNADPIYIVFRCQTDLLRKGTIGELACDYVMRDKATRRFQLVNYRVMEFFDEFLLLDDPENFARPMFAERAKHKSQGSQQPAAAGDRGTKGT
jgi:hypothetical protein